jgi:hypothetical protein
VQRIAAYDADDEDTDGGEDNQDKEEGEDDEWSLGIPDAIVDQSRTFPNTSAWMASGSTRSRI